MWALILSAPIRITVDTSFGGWERVTFVCKGGKLSLYINTILVHEDVSVNTTRMQKSPKSAVDFNGTIRIGRPQDFYDLNITGILFLRKALTKEQVTQTVFFRVPPGTQLYQPTISTQGAAAMSEYIPGREFNNSFLYSRVPPVGQFPRLLFSYDDQMSDAGCLCRRRVTSHSKVRMRKWEIGWRRKGTGSVSLKAASQEKCPMMNSYLGCLIWRRVRFW